MKLPVAILGIAFVLSSFSVVFAGELVDSRDGQTYKTIKVGPVEWMAENMNFKSKESVCYGKNKQNCSKYGRLYSWDDALEKACPDGWYLPSMDDFKLLVEASGGENMASVALKAKNGWFGSGNGTDAIGFSALPAGSVTNKNVYEGEKRFAGFWSSDESSEDGVSVFRLSYFDKKIEFEAEKSNPRFGFSVRCIHGSNIGVQDEDGREYKAVKIGKQVWMAENMNKDIPGSRCYDDDSLNCEKYGRLYTWEMARTICPDDWHLPSNEEFFKLRLFVYNAVGVEYGDIGFSIKSRIEWDANGDYPLMQPMDSYGFNALPAGRMNPSGNFVSKGNATSFWSSTKDEDFGPIGWHLDNFVDSFEGNADGLMLSVRCLKD